MTIEQRISAWVEERRSAYLQDVARLVAIRSVSGEPQPGMPFGEGPGCALLEAESICREHGMQTENVDGYVLTADVIPGHTELDILAHLDVVGEGNGWESDPYTATERDGCLYGRGTDDDKGPAVAALYAMECVRCLAPLKRNVRLILGTDEESGSQDIAYYYRSHAPAPNTFSPDASFPVFNTEKGGLTGRFSKRWEATSALPRVTELHGGYRINVLPSDAEARVVGLGRAAAEAICLPLAKQLGVAAAITEESDGVRIAVKGVSAHASTPEEGNNGITALIRLLCALPLAETESTAALRQLDCLLPHGDGLGQALGIAMADEISGPLTLAFSLLELDESGLQGSFDSRVPICATDENCRQAAKRRFEAAGFAFDAMLRPPHHTAADTPFVAAMLRSYEYYTGRKGECLSMGGGTYVHDIPGGVAFGAGMPDFVSNLHSANERMHIESMLTAIKIFAKVIYDLCC